MNAFKSTFFALSDDALLLLRDLEFRRPTAPLFSFLSGFRRPPSLSPNEEKGRFVFIHIPKNAGKSIGRALGLPHAFHIPASRYRRSGISSEFGFFAFCFVRNPWDRVRSAYYYLKHFSAPWNIESPIPDHRWASRWLGDCDSFSSFVCALQARSSFRRSVRRYIHFRDQLDWIVDPVQSCSTGSRPALLVDFIGRFEDLDRDFSIACKSIYPSSQSPPLLPLERCRDPFEYVADYQKETIRIVGDLYFRDIAFFGYKFGE